MANDILQNEAGEYFILGEDGNPKPITVAKNDSGSMVYHDGTDWKPMSLHAQPGQTEDTVSQTLDKAATPINRGIANVLGLPNVLYDATGAAGKYLAKFFFDADGPRLPNPFPSASDIENGMGYLGVKFRDATSPPGKVAQAAVQGATEAVASEPLALLKGAALAAKARSIAPLQQQAYDVVRSLAPAAVIGAGSGAGSEVAGEMASSDPRAQTYWRAVGGLTGGVGATITPFPASAARLASQTLGFEQKRDASELLKSMGVYNPSSELVSAVQASLNKNIQPQPAAVQGMASSLPVPVRLSRGQSTGFDPDLRFELNAAQGALGSGPADKMRGFKDAQQHALAENIPAIQGVIAPGASGVTAFNQGGQVAQQRLMSMAAAEKAKVNQAYQAARDAGVSVSPGVTQDIQASMMQGLGDFHPSSAPKSYSILQDMGADIAAAQKAGQAIPLQTLEARRTQLSNITRGSDPTEAAAARRAIGIYDEAMGGLADNAIFAPNAEAIDAWKAARDAHRAYKSRFGGGDMAQTLTDQQWRGGQLVPTTAPEKAGDAIFGATGLSSGPNTARDLVSLKGILGEDSQSWQALQAEAWRRIADKASNIIMGEKGVSGSKGIAAFERLMTSNKAVMDALYSPEQQQLMRQYFYVAAKASSRPEYSTAAQASSLLQTLWGAGSGAITGAISKIPFVGDIGRSVYGEAKSNLATNGTLPVREIMTPGARRIAIGAPTLLEMLNSGERR